MIDVETEELLTLGEAAKRLRVDGRAVSIRSTWRWALRGKLETIKMGGRRVTSAEAIARMLVRQNPDADPLISRATRRREITAAERRLQDARI